MNAADVERFWSKVDRRGPGECWPFKTAKPNGYGFAWIPSEKRNRPAHVLAWEIHNGRSMPSGLQGCHSCDNPPCCNPEHVFPGTQGDNIADSVRKGRYRSMTTYDRIAADPVRRRGLRTEELILSATCAISEEMDRRGVAKAELARRLGTSRGHVTGLLAGGRNLTLGSLAEMADALGCKVEVHVTVAGKSTGVKSLKRAARRSAVKA